MAVGGAAQAPSASLAQVPANRATLNTPRIRASAAAFAFVGESAPAPDVAPPSHTPGVNGRSAPSVGSIGLPTVNASSRGGGGTAARGTLPTSRKCCIHIV